MQKKLFTLTTLSLLIILSSCQKEVDYIGDPPVVDTASGISLPDTYLPLTTGTFWVYADSGLINANDTGTLTGDSMALNTITYHKVHTQNGITGNDAYYGVQGPNYYLYGEQAGEQVTMLILNDTTAVNNGWVYDMGLVNGIPGRGTGTILEKDIAYTVKGRQYTHVIHVNYIIAYNILGTYIDLSGYDIYFAKGIGIIKTESSVAVSVGESLSLQSKQELIDYTIK